MNYAKQAVGSATAGGLLAIVLWSATIALARSTSEALGPLTAASAVYLVAGGLSLLRGWVVRPRGAHRNGQSAKYVLGCGTLFLLYTMFLYVAVGLAKGRQQAIEIGLLNYLWPALTVVLSLVILRKRARALLWPGTGLALLGVILAMTTGSPISWRVFLDHCLSNPVAYAAGLMAAVTWALYSNLTRLWSSAHQGGSVAWFLMVTGLALWIASAASSEVTVWTRKAVWEVAVLGSMTALAYALWERAMQRGDLMLVAACSYFTPFLSTCVSCVYLGVVPAPKLWLGCGFIIAGSLMSWRSVVEAPDT
jgi:drug/metabolite transporter (DMT)-like permease